MEQKYKGRLELTWTNKDKRLLAQQTGNYEWVSPSDYRVAEVRLLQIVSDYGEVSGGNLLIQGDSLYALESLIKIPAYRDKYVGKVKLAYIDPPFNTRQTFEQYDDALEHSVWLTMIRDRLRSIQTLLSSDGSLWVHCDDSEQHRLRCVMDEVFGPENFVATVIWQKYAARDNRTVISTSHDYIHIYASKYSEFANVRNLIKYGEEQIQRYKNPDNDPRGPWQSDNMSGKAGPGRRQSQFYSITLPSGRIVDPPPGRCWIYTEERFREVIEDRRIWFGSEGDSVPRVKRFLSEVIGGLVPETLWLGSEVGTNDHAKKEILLVTPASIPFSTPKPERLMERIIHIASNPGDIVLDCFAGSGTTAAVAHKMGRRWVTVEWSEDTIHQFVLPRLEKVVDGQDPGGITESVVWTGGGGFEYLRVAPSMFANVGGRIMLADWATNGELSQAVAAQLGFDYSLDHPFCGRKGMQRLAVVDGMVNADVVNLLVQYLDKDELLLLCGTAVDPKARAVLRKLRLGSSIRKIPSALLAGYRYQPPEFVDDEAPSLKVAAQSEVLYHD